MRILYQSDILSIHDHRVLDKLSQTDNKVFVVTYSYAPISSAIATLPNLKFIHRPNGGVFGRIPIHSQGAGLLGKATLRLALLGAILDFRRKVKELKPDLIHAGFVQTSGLMTVLSGFRPYLLWPFGSDVLVRPDESLLQRSILRYVVRRAGLIACDCQAVKDRIIKLTGYPAADIRTIPMGVDLGKFRPITEKGSIRRRIGWTDENIVVIMTRSFAPVYGHKYFVPAIPRILAERPETRVLFIGDGPLLESIRAEVRRLGVEPFVHFAGEVDNEAMPAYLNDADIYVSSSLSDGSSLSLMEAMACGLPAVTSDVPANLEWIMDGVNGLIVPRRNVDGLVQRLLEMMSDKDRRIRMGAASLEIARERADWDRNAKILVDLYTEINERTD